MALAFCHVNIVCRSKGRSAVAGSAYRAGEKLKNEYNGKTYNYSRKQDVIYTEIMLPSHAPERLKDRGILWNSVELNEPQRNAQLARTFVFALPDEQSQEQNIATAKAIAERYVKEGMIVDLAVHDDGNGNAHAHIMATMRAINPDGTWQAKASKEYILDDKGERIRLPSGEWKSRKVNTTNWDDRGNVKIWREWYAEITNKHLELNGYEQRIDVRSLQEQGLERKPTNRLSRRDWEMEERGFQTPAGDINRQIREQNRQREANNRRLNELYELREKEKSAIEELEAGQGKKGIEPSTAEYEDLYKQPISHKRREKELDREKKGIEPSTAEYEDLYKQPVKERTYEKTKERTIHAEHDIRKYEERYKRDMNPVPKKTSEPHHEGKSEDREKRKEPSEAEYEDLYKQPPHHKGKGQVRDKDKSKDRKR